MLSSGEGGDQHHQSAFRQVEIGDEGIHSLELVARVDEDIRPAGLGFEGAVVIYQGFQRPAGGGAHADNAASAGLGLIENAGGLLIHHAQLAVHVVLQHLLGLHGAEGAQAHMEGDEGGLHALGADLLQQLLGDPPFPALINILALSANIAFLLYTYIRM